MGLIGSPEHGQPIQFVSVLLSVAHVQEIAAHHMVDNIAPTLFTRADVGYLACSQVDGGGDSHRQGDAFGRIPGGLCFVRRDWGKWRMMWCSLADLFKVLFEVAGGKRADTTDIEVKFFRAIRQDNLFVAVLNASAAQPLIESCPQVIPACDDPANALSCCCHHGSEEAVSFVYDLIGVDEDQQRVVPSELVQVMPYAQAKLHIGVQVVIKSGSQFFSQ